MPIVTHDGFQDIPDIQFIPLSELTDGTKQLDLPNDADLEALAPQLGGVEMIRVPFPSFADGRGFSVAQRLRDLGYKGHLRAQGHVISDQFRYALSCGFDDVEISEELAARQPAEHWIGETEFNYRAKLARR